MVNAIGVMVGYLLLNFRYTKPNGGFASGIPFSIVTFEASPPGDYIYPAFILIDILFWFCVVHFVFGYSLDCKNLSRTK